MAPPGSNGGMGAAAAAAEVDGKIDRFLERCSSEDRGRLLFKIVELELLAASPGEVRSAKKAIMTMYRGAADPPQRKKKKPSPEEILKERLREEAEAIEICRTVGGDASDDNERASPGNEEELEMPNDIEDNTSDVESGSVTYVSRQAAAILMKRLVDQFKQRLH